MSKLIKILLLISILPIIQCSNQNGTKETIVAQVGNKSITVSQFRSNYEFGLPHLKTGPDRKLTYLNYMILEEVLSQEGFKRGLDKNKRVQKLEQELMEELLVEELFQTEINNKITITNDQIRKAITKSKVRWKLRYWVEPDLFYANRVAAAMREQGYSQVLEDILKRNKEIDFKPKDFETPYMTWLDVPENVLEAIKNVEIGDISDPTEIDGKYFIFQVTDVQREALSEYDYQNDNEKYRQILFYRELKKQAAIYVAGYMKNKNVVTKGPSFSILAAALAEWKKMPEETRVPFVEAIKGSDSKESHLSKLYESLDQTLVTFKDGQWSLKDFLEKFDDKSVKALPDEKDTFMGQLNEQIGLSVRDYFLVGEAEKKKLQNSKAVKKQLALWRNKWVYEESRRLFSKDIHIDEKSAESYFNQYKEKYKIRWDDKPEFSEYKNQATRDAFIQKARNLLTNKVDSLKSFVPVQIYTAVLDTIPVIESEKSRWQSLQAFKRSSHRLAVPIVDPAWGL